MGILAFRVDAPSELPPEVERSLGEAASKALAPLVDDVSDAVTLGLLFVSILVVGMVCAFLLQRGRDHPDLYE
jgi:hypothetical protein